MRSHSCVRLTFQFETFSLEQNKRMYKLDVSVASNGFVEVEVGGNFEKLKREKVNGNTHLKISADLQEGQLVQFKHVILSEYSNNAKSGLFRVVDGKLVEVNSQPQ